MNGKVVLVTGASSGIGEAIANLFCQKGALVVGVARNEEKMAAMEEKLGKNFIYETANLSEFENIQKVFENCKNRGLKLDGVVHCAGIVSDIPIRTNSMQQTDQIMNINFGALVEIVRVVSSKRYSNDGASIVALSSIASLCGQKGSSIYAASKAAVNAFVKSASMELTSRKIRINAIAPAMVETPMYYRTAEIIPGIVEETQRKQPFGLIQPESVADLAEFLITEKSRYITGTVIPINAGFVF